MLLAKEVGQPMKLRVEQPSAVGASLAQVGRVKIPKRFSVHLTDHEDGSPDVELVYEVRNGVPECRQVHVKATNTGHEVRCSGLVGIRVEDVLEEALKTLLGIAIEGPEGIFTSLVRYDHGTGTITRDDREAIRQVRGARSGRKIKITDDLLRDVAKVYRANVEHEPTAAVAEHFDKAHRTAALYVHRAREAGHLGAAIKGKAGEK